MNQKNKKKNKNNKYNKKISYLDLELYIFKKKNNEDSPPRIKKSLPDKDANSEETLYVEKKQNTEVIQIDTTKDQKSSSITEEKNL